jgi:hypothetical protein
MIPEAKAEQAAQSARNSNSGSGKPNNGRAQGAAKIVPAGASRIPDPEFNALKAVKLTGKPKCNFFNSSVGCKFGATCKLEHKCKLCGADHPFIGNH